MSLFDCLSNRILTKVALLSFIFINHDNAHLSAEALEEAEAYFEEKAAKTEAVCDAQTAAWEKLNMNTNLKLRLTCVKFELVAGFVLGKVVFGKGFVKGKVWSIKLYHACVAKVSRRSWLVSHFYCLILISLFLDTCNQQSKVLMITNTKLHASSQACKRKQTFAKVAAAVHKLSLVLNHWTLRIA